MIVLDKNFQNLMEKKEEKIRKSIKQLMEIKLESVT